MSDVCSAKTDRERRERASAKLKTAPRRLGLTRNIEVLSAELTLHPTTYAEVSKERWNEVFDRYSREARNHVAHLAAHGYDVLLINGRVLMAQPSRFRSTEQVHGAHWLNDTPYDRDTYEPAAPKLLSQLYALRGRYNGHERLFQLPGR